MTSPPGPGSSAGSVTARSTRSPLLQPELLPLQQRRVDPGSDPRLPYRPAGVHRWRGGGKRPGGDFGLENRNGPEPNRPRTSIRDREWDSCLLYSGPQHAERLQVLQWLGKGAGPERDDRLIAGPLQVIEVQ